MFSLFATPLGWIMKGCYKLIGNYGLALLLFTLLTRLLMLPMSIKQQKSTARMSMLAPELDKLKKKYAKNQQKLNEETMLLYQREGVSPMASCLPMLISMLILFSMIPVIYGPLTYVSDLDKSSITKSNNTITEIAVISKDMNANGTTMAQLLADNDNDFDKVKSIVVDKDNYKNTYKMLGYEYDDKQSEKDDKEKMWKEIVEIFTKYPDIDLFITNSNYVSQNLVISRPELTTFDFVDTSKEGAKYQDILPENVREFARDFNYSVFGISLGEIPNMKSKLALIPIISFLLQIISTFVSSYFTKKNNGNAMGGGFKAMMLILPLFSLWIAFEYPAGLGLYWIYSSLFGLIQIVFLNIIYNPQHVRELVEKDIEKQKERRKNGKKTFMERALEMQQEQLKGQSAQSGNNDTDDDDDDDDGEVRKKKLSKYELKEIQRKKLNEARKRMAEKYGDEYIED